ncbi:MAG: hypothetical protein AAF389_11640 [Gemmatimonadota bacterium]
MIFKRYGTAFQSVDVNFDAKAMNEVGFRRNREESFPAEELGSRYEVIETKELVADASGDVQTETEQAMLDTLEQTLRGLLEGLPEGGIAVVENESGHDYPKPRQEIKNTVVEGENRLRFEYTIAPALRIGLYRPQG